MMSSLIGKVQATMRLRQPGRLASTVRTVGGLGLISLALGLWLMPVGIAAAGVSLLLLDWKATS